MARFSPAPWRSSANGTVRFTYPANLNGREITDIRLTFREGAVVEAHAAQGQEFLDQLLDTDAGARRLGEFAFGTNFGITRFTKNILFDEKIGGTIHMALGRSYPETGAVNESAIHTDIVCDLAPGWRNHRGRATLRKGWANTSFERHDDSYRIE